MEAKMEPDRDDREAEPQDQQQEAKVEPSELQIIKHVLQSMGVTECESGVITMLQMFLEQYKSELVRRSQDFAESAGGSRDFNQQHVRLAIETVGKEWFQDRLSRDLITRKADQVNSAPLPEITKKSGLKFPEEGQALVQANYAVLSMRAVDAAQQQQMGVDGGA